MITCLVVSTINMIDYFRRFLISLLMDLNRIVFIYILSNDIFYLLLSRSIISFFLFIYSKILFISSSLLYIKLCIWPYIFFDSLIVSAENVIFDKSDLLVIIEFRYFTIELCLLRSSWIYPLTYYKFKVFFAF